MRGKTPLEPLIVPETEWKRRRSSISTRTSGAGHAPFAGGVPSPARGFTRRSRVWDMVLGGLLVPSFGVVAFWRRGAGMGWVSYGPLSHVVSDFVDIWPDRMLTGPGYDETRAPSESGLLESETLFMQRCTKWTRSWGCLEVELPGQLDRPPGCCVEDAPEVRGIEIACHGASTF